MCEEGMVELTEKTTLCLFLFCMGLPRVCIFLCTAQLRDHPPNAPPPNTDSVLTISFLFSFSLFIFSSLYCCSSPGCSRSSSYFSFAILLSLPLWIYSTPDFPFHENLSVHLTFLIAFFLLPKTTTSLLPPSISFCPAIGFLSPVVSGGKRQWVPAHSSDQSRAAGLPSHCW